MKLSTKGLGWLIFGLLVIASSTESYGLKSKLSTIALGAVFVAVYLMKQYFRPRLYGLFIAGGVLLAFCIEADHDSSLVYSFILACVFMALFYLKNRNSVNDMIDTVDSAGDEELENFDYVAPETYEEPSAQDAYNAQEEGEEAAIEIDASVPDTVEFEFEPKKKTEKK